LEPRLENISGMARYSQALREQVIFGYEQGKTYQELARLHGLHPNTVRNLVKLKEQTGSIEPRSHGGGRARALDKAGEALLSELRLKHPDESQGELAARLADAGYQISAGTVSRYLKAAGFVRHAVKSSAKKALSEAGAKPATRRYRRTAQPPDAEHRRAYPSDLSDAEWALLEHLVPAPKTGGREPIHSRREIVNAIFYVLRSGCQWRMLPHDFPPWETVYDYFRRWRDSGVWESTNQALREKVRQRAGQEKTPSAVIIDSQSVKTTEKGGLVDMTERSV